MGKKEILGRKSNSGNKQEHGIRKGFSAFKEDLLGCNPSSLGVGVTLRSWRPTERASSHLQTTLPFLNQCLPSFNVLTSHLGTLFNFRVSLSRSGVSSKFLHF